MRSLVAWGLLPLALGCSFDATGVDTAAPASAASVDDGGAGDDSTGAAPGTSTGTPTTGEPGGGTGGGSTGPEATSEPLTTGPTPTTGPATTEPATTEPETTDASSTGTSTTTGEPETTDPSTTSTTTGAPETTGPPACDNSFKQILLVKDAVVEPPMKTEESKVNEGTIASSDVAEDGSVTFSFNLPCDGEVAVWGRVYDPYAGNNNYDPDSFWVSQDGGPEVGWGYGCQTSGPMGGYFWLRVHSVVFGQQCNTAVPWTLALGAGDHTIKLRNREAKNNQGVHAVVARLLVTTDMDYVPGAE